MNRPDPHAFLAPKSFSKETTPDKPIIVLPDSGNYLLMYAEDKAAYDSFGDTTVVFATINNEFVAHAIVQRWNAYVNAMNALIQARSALSGSLPVNTRESGWQQHVRVASQVQRALMPVAIPFAQAAGETMPAHGDYWREHDGTLHVVTGLANLPGLNPLRPATVDTLDAESGTRHSCPFDDWHRRMVFAGRTYDDAVRAVAAQTQVNPFAEDLVV